MSDVLTGFIMQYYEDAPYIPRTILIPDPGEDAEEFGIRDALETLEGFLEQKAGRKVALKTPERGEMKELQKLAQMNAREMMVRRILRGGGADADPMAPLRYLEEMFKVPEGTIGRVESYDISNLGNDDICAGMVVFKNGRPDKSSYRLFKMKTVMSQDDFASMREVLARRFAHDGSDGFSYPSLILVDGGKGQLSAVASVVDELAPGKGILLAGMVKNSKHRTSGIVFRDGELIKLDGENPSDRDVVLLRFLTAVQNEVHRFAISYQHKLAGKRNIRYKLEDIRGIGPAKRKALLSRFGSVKKIEGASVEELKETQGISETDALNIYDHFHQQEE